MPKKIAPAIRAAIERNAKRPWAAREMQQAIKRQIEDGKLKGAVPSVRTISGILATERGKSAEDRNRVTEVSWPESFDDDVGLLPWAAAPAYFELFQLLDGRKPLMPLMQWFWRVTQAAPDAPGRYRQNMAALLAMEECLPMLSLGGMETAQDSHAIEVYLAFAPWRSDDAMEAYHAAIPKERRFDAGTISWSMKSNTPEASLLWYSLELRDGVFTLDARDSYMNYVRRKQDEAGQTDTVDTSTRSRGRSRHAG